MSEHQYRQCTCDSEFAHEPWCMLHEPPIKTTEPGGYLEDNIRLCKRVAQLKQALSDAIGTMGRYEKRLAIAREALEFYAGDDTEISVMLAEDAEFYEKGDKPFGERARSALALLDRATTTTELLKRTSSSNCAGKQEGSGDE